MVEISNDTRIIIQLVCTGVVLASWLHVVLIKGKGRTYVYLSITLV